MKIKNILNALLAFCVGCGFVATTACSNDEDAFFTVSENDAPRILNTDIPAAGFTLNRDANLTFEVLVTPTDYTTVKWLVDGKEVFEGKTIDMPFEAGNYTVKIVAVTKQGKETSRTVPMTVKPLENDPQSASEKINERMVKPGATVKLSGDHLDKVQKVAINGQVIAATYIAAEGCVQYTVPAELANGIYRISFVDEAGQKFGAGKVAVATTTTFAKTVYSGSVLGGSVTVDGLYLDKVTAISVDGKECAITSKSDTQLTFTAPALNEGTYEFKATTSGEAVQFYNDGAFVSEGQYRSTMETMLIEGKFIIDWNADICNLSPELLAKVPVGSTIKIYYEVPEAEYHNMRIITKWWNDVPGGAQIDVTADTPNPFTLTYTDAFKALTDEQGGMSCVGFGYTVLRITFE
jgi:hypothetical protein